jgi:hypothetical protein
MAIDPRAAYDKNIYQSEMARLADGGATATANAGQPETNEFGVLTTSAGNWLPDDVLTRIRTIPTTGPIVTRWFKADGSELTVFPIVGTDVEDLDKQTLAALKSGGLRQMRPVIYKTVGGTGFALGYMDDLSGGQALYTSLSRAATVAIGLAAGNAIATSIEPARPYLIDTQSFPIAHAAAIIDPFVQPSIGSQVSITATNKSAIGTMPQFAVGSSVFLADANGVQIGGHYIIRANSYPTFSIELQNPAANELGAGQSAIAPGASTPALEMIAMSRLIPPVGVTHATLSVTRPNGAIVSAISGANSSIDTVLQQSQKDQAQINYPAVALNFAPASLGWDAGPKNWVQDSIALSKEELSCWLHAWADEGRTVYATVRWFGGVK